MNKLLFLAGTLAFSSQLMAKSGSYAPDAPPFGAMTCKAGSINVQVEIQRDYQKAGAGPALAHADGTTWIGEWDWEEAPEGTRLTSFHFLNVKANGPHGKSPFYLRTLYSPYGQLSGGWVEMPGVSGPIDCKMDLLSFLPDPE